MEFKSATRIRLGGCCDKTLHNALRNGDKSQFGPASLGTGCSKFGNAGLVMGEVVSARTPLIVEVGTLLCGVFSS